MSRVASLLTTKRRAFAVLFTLALAGAGTAYWVGTGPEDLSQYPSANQSPYRLPWTVGQSYRCAQSNRGIVSHRGPGRFAYDFAMPVGTEVRAVRGGEVVFVIVSHDGHGLRRPNNRLVIRHEDGTLGHYLHLKKGGSRVKVGDLVKQGQVLAASGHVGRSMIPHLHFHVTDSSRKSTLPITFSDVGKDAGIPRMFKTYTSGNVQPYPRAEQTKTRWQRSGVWWLGAESNRRHKDFQSSALPTELPSQHSVIKPGTTSCGKA